jgi:hypothetical protein
MPDVRLHERQENAMTTPQPVSFSDDDKPRARFDEIGWGLFLMMIGTIWLVPSVPPGTWLIGTGVLILGLNGFRYGWERHVSVFSSALGVLALAAGLGELLGIKVPLFAICLVLIGAWIIVKPLVSQRA